MTKEKLKQPTERKPRPTAAQRRAAHDAAIEMQQREIKKAEEAFEAVRPMKWLEVWAKALRLSILIKSYPAVAASYDWWFREFELDAKSQTFTTESVFSKTQSESEMRSYEFDDLNSGLDRAFEWIQEYEEEQERKRQEALRIEGQRQVALKKLAKADLTDEEVALLGIRR